MGQSKRQRRKNRAARIHAHAAAPARLGLTCPVTITAASAEQSGPRRFRLVAYTGEPMRLTGYDLPVVVDCATIDMRSQRIPALLDHVAWENSVVGQIERISVEGQNNTPPLVAEGIFCPTDDPRDATGIVLKKADAGFQWQASIGGDPGKVERVEAGQTVNVNGRSYAGPVFVARNVSLREISFVVLGADRLTSAVLARNREGKPMTFDAWLKAKGYDPTAIAAKLRAALKAAFDAELRAAEGDEEEDPEAQAAADDSEMEEEEEPTNAAARRPSIQANRPGNIADRHRQLVAAEEERIAMIRARCAESGISEIEVGDAPNIRKVNLVAHAIRERWDARDVELAIIRAERTAGPAVIVRSDDRDCTVQALEGAMILRAGGRLDNPAYTRREASSLPSWLRAPLNAEQRQRAMEAAHRYADMSAVDLCREALRIEGRDAPHNRTEMIQAAFSSSALTNIFTTNVNAILLSTYAEAPDTTQGWVSEQEVADFKTQERPALTKGGNLSKLPRGGEADHYSRSDLSESYKISRYAKQFVVDEQDIIDDSLGALGDTPREMGLAAARLRPDLVYGIMLANPTLGATGVALFSASNASANLLTSAALAAAKLKAASSAMRLFRENSVNLNLMPTHLVVPPTLEFTAYELVNSTENIIAGTAGSVTERGNVNSLQRLGLTVVSDARLENGVTHPDTGTAYSGSASTWWLVCNYARTIEVGYLRGTGRAPQTRSWRFNGEGKYGMGWDVKMDIGAKALDWKGFVQNTA